MKKALLKGFSLLEVLVAFTILALALLGMASVFPAGHAYIKESGNITKASFIAQSVIEEYRRKNFNQVINGTGTINQTDIFNSNSSTLTYTYTVTVSTIATDYKSISVFVTWPGNVGARNVTLSSTIYNKL